MWYLEVLLFASSALAITIDIRERLIDNRLILLILSNCLLIGIVGDSLSINIVQSIVVLSIGLALFRLGVLGAGDTKIFASYSLIIDKQYWLFTVATIGILGAIIGVFYWLFRYHSSIKGKQAKNIGVPYGIPIVLASLFSIYLSKLS